MTTLVEQYLEWWPRRCGPAKVLTTGKTAAQIYAGTDRPDFWMASLAMVNFTASKQALVAYLKDAAASHAAGDLVTRITAIAHTDSPATLDPHRLWAKNRRKAGTDQDDLERAFYYTVCYLIKNNPMGVQVPFELIVTYLMDELSQDVATVRTAAYVVLRGEVDEATWKTDIVTAEVYA